MEYRVYGGPIPIPVSDSQDIQWRKKGNEYKYKLKYKALIKRKLDLT